MRADLHVHSCFSDGSMSVQELAVLAKEKQLSVIALTDHDTVAGIPEMEQACREQGIRLIPGIEVSSSYHGTDIHILGFDVDCKNAAFTEQLETYRERRQVRNEKMILRMQEHGFAISAEALKERYPDSVITRAHLAEFLFEHGNVSSVSEAFERYLGRGCSCYVPKEMVSVPEAISCIRLGGGHAVVAHPSQYHMTNAQLEAFLREMIPCGLEGIEAIYSSYSKEEERYYRAIARKFGLHITGGSDFHGSKKPAISLGSGFGSLVVPEETASWLL